MQSIPTQADFAALFPEVLQEGFPFSLNLSLLREMSNEKILLLELAFRKKGASLLERVLAHDNLEAFETLFSNPVWRASTGLESDFETVLMNKIVHFKSRRCAKELFSLSFQNCLSFFNIAGQTRSWDREVLKEALKAIAIVDKKSNFLITETSSHIENNIQNLSLFKEDILLFLNQLNQQERNDRILTRMVSMKCATHFRDIRFVDICINSWREGDVKSKPGLSLLDKTNSLHTYANGKSKDGVEYEILFPSELPVTWYFSIYGLPGVSNMVAAGWPTNSPVLKLKTSTLTPQAKRAFECVKQILKSSAVNRKLLDYIEKTSSELKTDPIESEAKSVLLQFLQKALNGENIRGFDIEDINFSEIRDIPLSPLTMRLLIDQKSGKPMKKEELLIVAESTISMGFSLFESIKIAEEAFSVSSNSLNPHLKAFMESSTFNEIALTSTQNKQRRI